MSFKNSSTLSAFFLIIIAGMTSCQSVKEPEFQRIADFKIVKPGIAESEVSLDLEFKNMNGYKVSLKNMNCSLYVEGNYLGSLRLDSIIHIKRNELFTLPLKGKLDMSSLLKNALIFALKETVRIKAEGKGNIGRAGIYVNYPFLYEGNHSIKELLR